MKKTYLIPTLQVVKIQSVQLMINSIPVGGTYQSDNAVLGRQARFSDFYEEEE